MQLGVNDVQEDKRVELSSHRKISEPDSQGQRLKDYYRSHRQFGSENIYLFGAMVVPP